MSVFGTAWEAHPQAFFDGWRDVVRDDDIVLVPGDISWAMRMRDALADLEDIAALPGRKVLLRGNHDYWWPSISKLRAALPAGMFAVQNDALELDGVVLEGELHIESQGTTVVLRPGDSARVNPGGVGRYWAPVYARMITIYGPNPEGLESHSFKYSEV